MYIHIRKNLNKGYQMTVPLRKWGNSLAIRIPKDMANTLCIQYDSMVELNIVDGALILEPKKETRLENLISKINKENLHSEINTGESMGNEEW
jgi:antitoxin MazE